MENLKRIWWAWRLYQKGKRVERARGQLQHLYEKGVQTDDSKMCRAIRRFNKRCYEWTCLEKKYNSGKG